MRGAGVARSHKLVEHDDGKLAFEPRVEFTCPITLDAPVQPVLAADGDIYEKSALVKWFDSEKKKQRESKEAEMRRFLSELQTGIFNMGRRQDLQDQLQSLEQDSSQPKYTSIKSPAINLPLDDDSLMDIGPLRHMIEAHLNNTPELREQREERREQRALLASKSEQLTAFAKQAELLVHELEAEKEKLKAENHRSQERLQDMQRGRKRRWFLLSRCKAEEFHIAPAFVERS